MTTFINIHHFKFVYAWYLYRRPSMRTVRVDWSVKGYHHFKIRPHPEVTMLVEPENDNRYDPFQGFFLQFCEGALRPFRLGKLAR